MNLIQTMEIAEGRKVNAANAVSIVQGLEWFNKAASPMDSLLPDHRLAQYMAQLSHESMGMTYDEELASGRAYEGRVDLGNTQPGDGVKFKGRSGIQLTGRSNYRRFTAWCRERWPDAPDFEDNPELVNTDPWEGLAPIWYWTKGNPTGKTLNYYADTGNLEAITRKVNGGVNGLADRQQRFTNYGLTLAGFFTNKTGIRQFQEYAGFTGRDVDGVAGQKTRDALHTALLRRSTPAPEVAPIALAAGVYAPGKYRATVDADGTLTVETF